MDTIKVSFALVKRSELEPEYAYSIELQAPAGNWTKYLATNDRGLALDMAQHYVNNGRVARLVLERE